ncbi:MAG TPA: hypothetical protein VK057_03810 [Bacillota bacterium]|nr:hypothetical protein [Bacillota bacterium]
MCKRAEFISWKIPSRTNPQNLPSESHVNMGASSALTKQSGMYDASKKWWYRGRASSFVLL